MSVNNWTHPRELWTADTRHLSEDEAAERLVHARRSVDELEEVDAVAVLLHHHDERLALVERVEHLQWDTPTYNNMISVHQLFCANLYDVGVLELAQDVVLHRNTPEALARHPAVVEHFVLENRLADDLLAKTKTNKSKITR